MSVVVAERHGRSAFAFLKGSPEMVASLCRAETGLRHHLFSLHMAFFFFFLHQLCATFDLICIFNDVYSAATVCCQVGQLLKRRPEGSGFGL